MRYLRLSLRSLALAVFVGVLAPAPAARAELPLNTYSIVARDPRTGDFGVAVQSHWFQVGPLAAWAEAGVGAVATQALTNPAYGPEGLALMREGKSAQEALDLLLERDPKRHNRQVAFVDAKGRVAQWTGEKCLPAAGGSRGEGFATQANLMATDKVWPAMAAAYREADGPLAERLLAALVAAERSGGDLRGAQSAALLIVPAKATGKPWEDVSMSLRVADHPQPVQELARLLRLRRAYDAWAAADTLLAAGKKEQARKGFELANMLSDGSSELIFWGAVSRYQAGDREEALAALGDLFRRDGRWRELLRRLPDGAVLSSEDAAAILKATER